MLAIPHKSAPSANIISFILLLSIIQCPLRKFQFDILLNALICKKFFYWRSINPMIEKINPTTPIPTASNSIPDEQREITTAKSSIAIPNPIFFIVPSFTASHLILCQTPR